MGKPRGEFEWIERFRWLLGTAQGDLIVGPGDDCAAVSLGDDRLQLLTCDALVEGRHFSRSSFSPIALGRRLAAVNVSDVAAMGGDPRWALLSLALPDHTAEEWTEGLVEGVSAGLAEHGARLVGGNLSGSEAGIFADLTLLGEVEAEHIVLRRGARPGDAVLVTGSLGAAAAGVRLLQAEDVAVSAEARCSVLRAYREPQPRVSEGRVLARSGSVTSMIDLSDGAASDLGHICRSSGVGAEVAAESLPISDATRTVAHALGIEPWRIAAAGGEDYELLFTVRAEAVDDLSRAVVETTGTRVTRIGRITEDAEARWLDPEGRAARDLAGWDHFRR